nr:talin-1-like [Crassostrea gigas]
MAQLVLKAKSVASTTEDQGLQNKVISSATSCALTTARGLYQVYPCTSQNKLIDRATVCTLATFQLEACSKLHDFGSVVAPTISSPVCQEQLIHATKSVAHSVEGIVEAAQQSCRDDKLLADLGTAATAVTQALNGLLQHIKKGAGPTAAGESHEDAVDTILTVTDRLFSSVGDAHEMVRQARQLAQATSSLVGAIRGEAEGHTDSDMQKRLLAAARLLADATANMVEAAKGCASSPNDSEQQKRLRGATEDPQAATNIAASNALKKKLIRRLENAARRTASATTQLINASKNATPTKPRNIN